MKTLKVFLFALLVLVFTASLVDARSSGGGSFSSGGRSSFSSGSFSSSRSSSGSFSSSSRSTSSSSSKSAVSSSSPSSTSKGWSSSGSSRSSSTGRTYVYNPPVYHYSPNYVRPPTSNVYYVSEPSSGFGSFWMNMWIYQHFFERRPQWDETRGARPVVKASVTDNSTGTAVTQTESYSEWAPAKKKKFDFADYAFFGAIAVLVGVIIWGSVALYRRNKNA